jgi:flagellar motor switch protein FliG
MESTESSKTIEDFLMDDESQDNIHQKYSDIFGYTLSAATRLEMKMSVQSNEILSLGALKKQMPEFSSWTQFHVKPTALHGFLVMEPSFVFQLLDIFYGGIGELPDIPGKQRPFSDIEQRLMKRLAVSMLEDLQKAWKPVYPIEPEYGSQKSEPVGITEYFAEDSQFRVINFEVRYRETRSMTVQLCYPLQSKKVGIILSHEHPQTVALILAHLEEPIQRAWAVRELPDNMQADVTYRMAILESIPPGVIQEIEEVLASEVLVKVPKAAEAAGAGKVGGVEAVAEMLNTMPRRTEARILGTIEESNAPLAEQIRQIMFTFEDLVLVEPKGIQAILQEMPKDQLLLALKTVSDTVREYILRNMSTKAADMVRKEVGDLDIGKVPVADMDLAEQKMVIAARKLDDEGKIKIVGGVNYAMIGKKE